MMVFGGGGGGGGVLKSATSNDGDLACNEISRHSVKK